MWCYLVEVVRHLSVAEIIPQTKLVPFSRPRHAAWSSSLIWWPICKCTTSPIIVTLRTPTNRESQMVRQFRRSHRRTTWRDLGLISQRNGYLHRAFGSVEASAEIRYSQNIMICFRKKGRGIAGGASGRCPQPLLLRLFLCVARAHGIVHGQYQKSWADTKNRRETKRRITLGHLPALLADLSAPPSRSPEPHESYHSDLCLRCQLVRRNTIITVMAEVIGIAGGVMSLTGLIKQLMSFYDLYNNLRDVPEDIRQMTTELAILRSTLNNSGLRFQQLESQGYDTEEFRSLLPVMNKWLEETQKTLTDCTANAKDGRRSKLGKQIKSLLKKKKIGNQVAQLARMQATSTEARFNLERWMSTALFLHTADGTNLQFS